MRLREPLELVRLQGKNCDAPNCRIKYGENLRALVSYLSVVQCISFKRIAEFISDLCGQKISEGTVQNILKENSKKADPAYEEIRRRVEQSDVVGADETGAAVEKELHWNWIFQTNLLTYVFQMKSRGQEAVDSKFPNGLPHSTLVTDRKRTYFNMNVKGHQVCQAPLIYGIAYVKKEVGNAFGQIQLANEIAFPRNGVGNLYLRHRRSGRQ